MLMNFCAMRLQPNGRQDIVAYANTLAPKRLDSVAFGQATKLSINHEGRFHHLSERWTCALPD
jgi:hypothetical protein